MSAEVPNLTDPIYAYRVPHPAGEGVWMVMARPFLVQRSKEPCPFFPLLDGALRPRREPKKYTEWEAKCAVEDFTKTATGAAGSKAGRRRRR